jgi:hypothetical protein
MEHYSFQPFQLLHASINTGINSLEYQMIKKQLNHEELNVFKKWQERQSAINKRLGEDLPDKKIVVRMVDVDIFLIVQIVVGICNNPFNNLKEKEKNIKKIIQCSIDRLGVA